MVVQLLRDSIMVVSGCEVPCMAASAHSKVSPWFVDAATYLSQSLLFVLQPLQLGLCVHSSAAVVNNWTAERAGHVHILCLIHMISS